MLRSFKAQTFGARAFIPVWGRAAAEAHVSKHYGGGGRRWGRYTGSRPAVPDRQSPAWVDLAEAKALQLANAAPPSTASRASRSMAATAPAALGVSADAKARTARRDVSIIAGAGTDVGPLPAVLLYVLDEFF